MWIQVRSMDGRKSVRIDNLSKLTPIEQLRERLAKEFSAEPSRQRLFYRGQAGAVSTMIISCLFVSSRNMYCGATVSFCASNFELEVENTLSKLLITLLY